MDATVVDLAIRTFLREARERLEEAAATAKAAEACAEAGQPDRGVEIANDIDEPIHDAEQLLRMATTLVRLTRIR